MAKNRHGLVKKKEHVKYLQQQLDTERATQRKLQLRREKLQYNMEYVKESFKYSEQVRKQQTKGKCFCSIFHFPSCNSSKLNWGVRSSTPKLFRKVNVLSSKTFLACSVLHVELTNFN